jgi:hypothetical protein
MIGRIGDQGPIEHRPIGLTHSEAVLSGENGHTEQVPAQDPRNENNDSDEYEAAHWRSPEQRVKRLLAAGPEAETPHACNNP